MTDWTGRTLSKVEIGKLLGRGGMAEVYAGRHTTLNRPVAVKVLFGHLSEDEDLLGRFRAEAQAVAALRHPNIVQVFDFDVADDRPYIVMEFVDGPSLVDHLRQVQRAGATVPAEVVAGWVTAIASALDYAHARGIVHRDVKPANVMLRREGRPLDPNTPLPSDATPVLTDFGVARMAGSGVRTASGMVCGTPAYMSPEQARGDVVDGRSDVYSLGVMLYEMLAGRLPFDSPTPAALLVKHITEAPPPLPGASPPIQAVMDRALAKDPAARYARAGDLAADFCRALGKEPAGAQATQVAAPPPTDRASLHSPSPLPATQVIRRGPARRGPIVVAGLGVLLFVVGVGAFGLLKAGVFGGGPSAAANLGTLGFRDGAARVDEMAVSVAGLAAPEAGHRYEVWLLDTQGESRRSLGTLAIDSDGIGQIVIVDPAGENLLARFDRFEITLEPDPDSSANPSGEVAYSGGVPPGPLSHIRHVLSGLDGTPGNIGLAVGLLRDAELLNSIVQAMLAAQESGDAAAVKQGAEAILNLIVGRSGEAYGDADGDGDVRDPGDGFGLLLNGDSIGYIQGVTDHTQLAADAPDATAGIRMHAEHVATSTGNLDEWAAAMRDLALRIASGAGDPSSQDIREMVSLADRLLNGTDLNGDELVDPVPGEGGAITAYRHAQYMADMPVLEGRNRLPAPVEASASP